MIDEENTNRNSKDSMFTALFGEKQNLLELYNAVSGQNYPKDTEIEIVTLSNVFYLKQKNDLAFTIGDKFVVLIEHQSTINENMPLRMLIYIGREYEKLVNMRDRYRRKIVKIPTPEFIVLYNGFEEYPDYKELKLSDSFEVKGDSCNLELVAKVYNINKGRNVEIANRSPVLNGYEEFIAEFAENRKTMHHHEAVRSAIKTCKKNNILLSFLEEHTSEIENMLFGEWDMDIALEVAKEEAREDALAEGRAEGIRKGKEEGLQQGEAKAREELFALLESGVSLAEAKKMFSRK